MAPPGFVWDARIRQAPLLSVRVRDGYLEGTGMMQARLANLIPVVDERGSAHLSAAALQRYLAEAPWLPTALLPGSGVRWDPIDPTRARATLTDRGHAVAVEFEFGSRGEIVRTFAPDRYRDVNGTGVPTPWVGRHMEYAEVYGMRIPMQSEVAWMLPDGPFAYWRGHIQQIEFDFAP
ncbi:MAG: hypothetical protein HYU37_18000 [Acidobacteria bacterium]|nr:hypothetical protein [Acidobacteriota bacterium]